MQTPNQRAVITIGNFDGVHLGHRLLVESAVRRAAAMGASAAAVTFEPHPVSFFKGLEPAAFRIQTPDSRDAALRSLGIATVDRIPFDRELTALTPAAFVERLASRHPGLVEVHVGEDFRFGAHRAGDTAVLAGLGGQTGFSVVVHPAVTFGDEAVSSSRVRAALRAADMPTVGALLGRTYTVEGKIAAGHGRGRVLGVPTLNLYPADRLLPSNGVYVASILSGSQVIRAVANLGVRPTFADDPRVSLEAHALDDFAPLSESVAVELHAYLRPEQRFENTEALREQIGRDIAAAVAWHAGAARGS